MNQEEVLLEIRGDLSDIKEGLLGSHESQGFFERVRVLEEAQRKRDRVLWGMGAGLCATGFAWIKQLLGLSI